MSRYGYQNKNGAAKFVFPHKKGEYLCCHWKSDKPSSNSSKPIPVSSKINTYVILLQYPWDCDQPIATFVIARTIESQFLHFALLMDIGFWISPHFQFLRIYFNEKKTHVKFDLFICLWLCFFFQFLIFISSV